MFVETMVLQSKHAMTASKAREISEAWKKAGSQACRHSFADSLELDEASDMTTNVCAVCGSFTTGLQELSAVASVK
jgi:hypothetical protein